MPDLVTPVSEYCQRWSNGQHSWRHRRDGGFDPSRYAVEMIPDAVAREFVTRHHYATSYPAARVAYGLTTVDTDSLTGPLTNVGGRVLVGVAVLSVPMRASVLTNVFPHLEPYAQTLELGRFVLADSVPANAESWMLGRVFASAATDLGLRGLVSFADPMARTRQVLVTDADGATRMRTQTLTPGHTGVIYQALNAVACGRSTARTLTYLPRNGVVLSDRTLSKIRGQESGAAAAERHLVGLGARPRREGADPGRWLRDALDDVGAVRVRHPGNFRYAWPLGTRAVRRRTVIALPVTPYPKPGTDLMPAPAAG